MDAPPHAARAATQKTGVERALDVCLALSFMSWAVLGILDDEGPPLLARLGAALVNGTVSVLMLVRAPPLREARVSDVARALPSIIVGGLAWRVSGNAWPAPLPSAFLALSCFTAATLAWLGTSFAILPARRGLKRTGPYAMVRHPAYALEVLLAATAAGAYRTWAALLVLVLLPLALAPRIAAEEALLEHDPGYEAYRRRVRWRLLPFIY